MQQQDDENHFGLEPEPLGGDERVDPSRPARPVGRPIDEEAGGEEPGGESADDGGLSEDDAFAELMNAEEGGPIEVEPEEPAEEAPPRPAVPERAKKKVPTGVPLEPPEGAPKTPPDEPRRSSVRDLDVCPNCGAPMRSTGELVCMRCGYDMKAMKVVETEVGEAVEEEKSAEELPPVCVPGRGDLWLPGALGIASVVVMLLCYLLAYDGLFPPLEKANDGTFPPLEVNFGGRLLAILRFLVCSVMWSAAGMGAIYVLARLTERKVGGLRLALVRVLGIATAMALVALIGFDNDYYFAERAVEILMQIVLAGSLAMLFFGLNLRDTALCASAAIVLFIALYCSAWLVVWAT